MIYAERIRQARELCGLTQGELAKLVGVNQSAIAHIESSRNIPSPELLNLIAAQTNFLSSFFEQEPIQNFPLGSLVFRSRASLTAREEEQAYQYAKVMFEQAKMMLEHLSIPTLRLPRLIESHITAAQVTRSSFGLAPNEPIKKLINVIEKNGVFVLALPIVLNKLDAFSTWVEMDIERPLLIIASNKPSDRLRFSIAHELGHLVMHTALKGRVTEAEKEANRFAAEFLLPESAMKEEIVPPVTLTTVARLKPRWGVSMQSIIVRSYELGIITNRQYRYLFEQLSARGWRTREPGNLDIPEEKPQVFSKMIERLYGDSNTSESYAKDMHLTVQRALDLISSLIDKHKPPLNDYVVSPKQMVYSRN